MQNHHMLYWVMLIVPSGILRREIMILNSRFIATLAPAGSVEEARSFIQTVRKELPDASHHVPAFVIGGGNTHTDFSSDDGESSGTSGRPLLAVLKGSGLANVAVELLGDRARGKRRIFVNRLILVSKRSGENHEPWFG